MLLPDDLWARVSLGRFEEPAGERLDPGYRGARQRFAFVAAVLGLKAALTTTGAVCSPEHAYSGR